MAERASPSTSDVRLRDMVARLQRLEVRAVASAYQITEGDDVVTVDTTGGNVTVTLPLSALGHAVYVRKSAAANTLTIAGKGSETINGAATMALTTQYSSVLLIPLSASTWGVF